MVSEYLVCKETAKLFSWVAVTYYIPTTNIVWKMQFLYILSSCGIVTIFKF